MGTRSIHFNDPTDTQTFGMVQFQATTLLAPGDSAPEPLPLLFFLSGLEGLGGIRDTTVQDQMRMKNWPAGSLVLVAPLRKSSHWWFSDNSKNYGWLEGNLDVELVCNMALLLEELAKHPRVDPRKIVLYGFSAGAYAISELLTTHQSVIARTIVLGGIHGHGDSVTQCQVLALPPKLQQRIPEFEKKWEAYLLRLASGPNIHPDRMVVVHNTLDTLSYWAPAREIWQAMDDKDLGRNESPQTQNLLEASLSQL
eukprot:6471511-Amphidinium_carterae.2